MPATLNEPPRILWLAEARSTNASLRERLEKEREKLPEGSVVIAEKQTSGRGQVGNSWESEPGRNLTFSVVLYPDCIPANQQFLISQIVALSVKETLDAYVEGIQVKWPNDIYHREKKICGILIENDLAGNFMYCSIIGIGINLNQEVFLSDAPNPVSLTQLTGRTYDKKKVLGEFLDRLYAYYLLLLQEKYDEVRARYRRALYRGEGYFPYADAGGPFEASIREIEPTGHLVLALRNGSVRRYAFKEVFCLPSLPSQAEREGFPAPFK